MRSTKMPVRILVAIIAIGLSLSTETASACRKKCRRTYRQVCCQATPKGPVVTRYCRENCLLKTDQGWSGIWNAPSQSACSMGVACIVPFRNVISGPKPHSKCIDGVTLMEMTFIWPYN
jgi:hypothetical protein